MIYLWLLVFTLAGPLLYSFDRRICYWRKWRALAPGIIFTALYFLVWDEIFTQQGVWGFNPRYLLGWYLFSLPVEEVLFFFVVPFSCVFLYEIMNYYVARDIFIRLARGLTILMAIGLFSLGLIFHQRLYTGTTFLLCSSLLALHGFYWHVKYLGRFYLGYLVSLIPFTIVNGVLTGSWIAEPIVWYNNSENLGIRIGTIPLEDSVYLLLMLLSVVTIYEYLLQRPHSRYLTPVSSSKRTVTSSVSFFAKLRL